MRRVALRMPSVIASPKTTSKAESLAVTILLAPAMPARRAACGWSASPINLQLLATGLGEQQRGKDKNQIRAGGEYRDGVSQGHGRSEEHTSELQSQSNLVCRLLLEKKKKKIKL